jgi:hypothetical protein
LFQTVSVMVITLSGIVGWMLATDKSLATLPIAMMMVAAALTMIPASLFMQRYGRKTGFMLGATLGGVGGLLAAVAIWQENFPLFVAANMLVGCYQAFAQYYRFAAADAASADFRSRAISWVIAGGVIAAVAGPNLVRLTQNVGTVPSALTYLSMVALSILVILLLSRLSLPAVSKRSAGNGSRLAQHHEATHISDCFGGIFHRFFRDAAGNDRNAPGHAVVRPDYQFCGNRNPVACARDVRALFFYRQSDSTLWRIDDHDQWRSAVAWACGDCIVRHGIPALPVRPDFARSGLELSVYRRHHPADRSVPTL